MAGGTSLSFLINKKSFIKSLIGLSIESAAIPRSRRGTAMSLRSAGATTSMGEHRGCVRNAINLCDITVHVSAKSNFYLAK